MYETKVRKEGWEQTEAGVVFAAAAALPRSLFFTCSSKHTKVLVLATGLERRRLLVSVLLCAELFVLF